MGFDYAYQQLHEALLSMVADPAGLQARICTAHATWLHCIQPQHLPVDAQPLLARLNEALTPLRSGFSDAAPATSPEALTEDDAAAAMYLFLELYAAVTRARGRG